MNTSNKSGNLEALAPGSVTYGLVTHEACFDRFTITINSPTKQGYRALYVDEPRTDGEGALIEMKGNAFLLVIINTPNRPVQLPVEMRGGRMIQEIGLGGIFEGQTSFLIGLDRKRPFSVHYPASEAKNTTRIMVTFAR